MQTNAGSADVAIHWRSEMRVTCAVVHRTMLDFFLIYIIICWRCERFTFIHLFRDFYENFLDSFRARKRMKIGIASRKCYPREWVRSTHASSCNEMKNHFFFCFVFCFHNLFHRIEFVFSPIESLSLHSGSIWKKY